MSKYHMKKLRMLGKRYARATTMSHNEALNTLAMQFGFAHWKELADAAKGEWQPNDEELTQAEVFVSQAGGKINGNAPCDDSIVFSEPVWEEGELCGHQYQFGEYLGDVVVSGKDWDIRIPEAPFKAPIVEIDERYSETSPVKDPKFLTKLLDIAQKRSTKVRAQMAVDWPRRSTNADHDGVARHPLWGEDSASWYCHSCDAQITGVQAAENYWHCPNCGTHPLNIHNIPFDDQCPGQPVKTPKSAQREKPEIRIVEPRFTLHLNEETVSMLIRCALLEDAATVNERLGAMRAEISLIDGEVVWITFDELLWPEDKEPTKALMVAAKIGVEVEQEISLFAEPFDWPDLGSNTSDTSEFAETLLKAYEEFGVIKR